MSHQQRSKTCRDNSRLAAWFAAAGCLGLCAALVIPAFTGTPAASAPLTPAADKPAGDETISFNRDIRPILSDKCFACHGPDAAVAVGAGGFRLDIREGAVAPAEASGKLPIVPGNADASEIIKRLVSDKPNRVMPPPKAKLIVTDEEIELLKRWIDEGAKYEGHWAYETPVKPALPEINEASEKWVHNNIDRFLAKRLERAGLSPSKEAGRATLIRRVSLDLTGLPPTPEEIDAFIADGSPDAYEKLVDRLLASPHFGERLALIWLDASRYGDTNGFHHDNVRTAWPWRQWVIEAFNDNMPYNQFIIEQLAGDLLPDATQQQILASGFCRMHNINDEGGALDEEYIVEAVADRIETIGTVLMAQTYTCARCHDHKYDPISQKDYFATWAYFNSIDQEEGVYRANFSEARAYPPRMMWKSEELQAQLDELLPKLDAARVERDKNRPALEKKLSVWQEGLRAKAGVQWAESELTTAISSHDKTKVEIKPDRSAQLSGKNAPAKEDITLTLTTQATELRVVKLDALPVKVRRRMLLGRVKTGNAVLTHFTVTATSTQDPSKTEDVAFTYAWADHTQSAGDYDILNALRNDKLGWAVDGQKKEGPRTAIFIADKPFGFEGGTELRVTLKHQSDFKQHTLANVRVDFASANDDLLALIPTVRGDWFELGGYHDTADKAFAKRYGPEDATRIDPRDKTTFKPKAWVHLPDFADGKINERWGANRAFYFGRSVFSPVERKVNLSIGSRQGLQIYLNGKEVFAKNLKREAKPDQDQASMTLMPGENILIVKTSNGEEGVAKFYYAPTEPAGVDLPMQPFALIDRGLLPDTTYDRFFADWRETKAPANDKVAKRLASLEAEHKTLEEQAVPVLIMKEAAEPVPAYILERGAYDKPIKERLDEEGNLVPVPPVDRKPPSMVSLPMPEGAPNNRLGFAQWLTQPEHPLTARVHVNRLWQMFFGFGIVKTVEDFGSQADWPSHPQLLDYLAVRFIESGWDQKQLIRQIVTSAAYRQKATRNTNADEIDADNRLLSYFPRQRLKGEFIRDQALHVAGLLDDQIGGASVRPYQPGDLWNEVAIGGSNTMRFKRGGVEDLYRRSMYTFWKKTSPPPQMQVFNAPTREFCVVSRDTTNTPLQVLTLWNDEQFLEAARVLAQRTLAEADEDEKRLELIYRRCTGDLPNAGELGVLQDVLAYYRERYTGSQEDAKALLSQGEHPLPDKHDPAELASWMMVASTALSLDQTIVRD